MVTMQCPCGYTILCKVRPLGERVGTLAFLDNKPTSEICGERMKSCPGCGAQLELLRLWVENLRR
jgi:hypothetical protein